MAAVSKFLFDTEIDADDGATAPPSRPDMRRYTAAEMEAASSAARAAGHAAGRAEAEAEIGRRTSESLQVIGSRLGEVLAEGAARHEAQLREAVTAATEIVRRLLPALGRREAMAEIEALIAECLARLHDEPRLVIRVADELLDPVRERIDRLAATTGFSGRVILLAEGSLRPGDARVEWAD